MEVVVKEREVVVTYRHKVKVEICMHEEVICDGGVEICIHVEVICDGGVGVLHALVESNRLAGMNSKSYDHHQRH
uniref:Uncharacterized protein n=1 Tax=Phaseolus vulgaris TaxID=3885 RepID=V7BWI3_PHAVU|nr:hypothetical protein PHAVU_005G148100g [Phaseolus vulgaris]XP_007150373.1 hypothetical protein PHAVU_005G148100g [Phaseolus vulgaris]ESW22366.1 hypothetical protein PHAVU_005G148100g [Phaseolus vulgaris]ESW22367.1 hypothetical protein PHAVU_005G148100g [Phaseolus vulgaris]